MIESGPNYQALSFWVIATQAAFNVIVMVAGGISLRRKATAAEIKAVADQMAVLQKQQSERCGRHLDCTTTLEGRAKSAPTYTDMGQVHDRITAVKGGVDELTGMLKGMRDNVNLLVDHHLRGGKP